MKTRIEKDRGRALVVMPPKMFRNESGELSRTVNELARRGVKEIILDMRKTTMMDSASLGVLLFSRKHLGPQGVEIALANTDGYVRSLIENAGLSRLFKLIDYGEDA
ncbi:MAG: hypothetical protein A2293_15135 [Elusimicrobia bacterium RIFOXYB2_FULL_49_7]|nr:MAG: hypothetical protein A2293_15135 [Elusimicrobia bacterium RIFOXYB2_FULL_49_7]